MQNSSNEENNCCSSDCDSKHLEQLEVWFSFATWDYPGISLMLSFARVWRTKSRTPEGTGEYVAGQQASGY